MIWKVRGLCVERFVRTLVAMHSNALPTSQNHLSSIFFLIPNNLLRFQYFLWLLFFDRWSPRLRFEALLRTHSPHRCCSKPSGTEVCAIVSARLDTVLSKSQINSIGHSVHRSIVHSITPPIT